MFPLSILTVQLWKSFMEEREFCVLCFELSFRLLKLNNILLLGLEIFISNFKYSQWSQF